MYEPSKILTPLLFIPGILFEGAVRVRNRMFLMKVLSQHRLAAPVISVGNLTLGGTGKTPAVIFLAKRLLLMGAVPALLSRGYGRRSPRDIRTVPPGLEIPSAPSVLGDEPALIRRGVPGIWLGIAGDRYSSGLRILERRKDAVFILDDGFQHQRLHRDLDVVVIDSSQPFHSNRVFPRGSLREPLSGLRRAHVIMLNSSSSEPAVGATEETIRRVHPSAAFLHCRQEIESLVPYDQWRRGSTEDAGRPASACLVAAVGNARRFESDVESLGIKIQGRCFYRDHASLRLRDWDAGAASALHAGAEAIITTEKDAVKLAQPPRFPLLVAVQKMSLVETAELDGMLRRVLERASAQNLAR